MIILSQKDQNKWLQNQQLARKQMLYMVLFKHKQTHQLIKSHNSRQPKYYQIYQNQRKNRNVELKDNNNCSDTKLN